MTCQRGLYNRVITTQFATCWSLGRRMLVLELGGRDQRAEPFIWARRYGDKRMS